MVGMDRAELADFLRSRRERLQPSDVGLPPGMRRRSVGLRREEVAQLAGMSTDYYARLEQTRGPNPSVEILASLARALRLTDDERDHLFHLADQAPPARLATGHVSPGMLALLDRLADTPAFVVSDLGETLVQNAMAVAVFGEQTHWTGRDRFASWRWFTNPGAQPRFPDEDAEQHASNHVADLRATHGRRHGDEDVESLVADLLAASPEFTERWERHDVRVRRGDRKRILHPEVGLLDLLCESMLSDVSGHRVVILFARPGSEAQDQLALLRVIGTQDLTST